MRRALLVLLLVPAFGLVLTSAANAHAVLHVSGTDLGPDAGTTSCHPINAAGSLLSCDTPDFATEYSGDLTGTISTDFKWVINCSSSVIDGHGAELFTGSLARMGSGTLRWETKFHAAFDCSTQTLSNLHGTGTIMSGTGALAGLRGTLIFTDQEYSGILLKRRCSPCGTATGITSGARLRDASPGCAETSPRRVLSISRGPRRCTRP